jgi:hypothetical protein
MRAVVTIETRDRGGALVESRRAKNAVMQAGAMLIARLFSGTGAAITHMGVGTSEAPEPDDFSTAALRNEADGDIPALTGVTEAAIPAEAFVIETDTVRRVVRVRVRATIPPDAAVGKVREAGLLSRAGDAAVLYNRVTFSPIDKGADHELTMFWEVTFPYGDLQWVM